MKQINLFEVNENTLEYYLHIVNKTKDEFYEINNSFGNWTCGIKEIFEKYKHVIDTGEFKEKYSIKIKHITTLNDEGIELFENRGFLTLREMLTISESPMKIFLENNNIKVDVENNVLFLCGLEIYYGGGLDDYNSNFVKVLGTEYSEISGFSINEYLCVLNAKLNYNAGETEFFVCGSFEKIKSYSNVKDRPEILNTLAEICKDFYIELRHDETIEESIILELSNSYKTLCENWEKQYNDTYLIEAFVDLDKIDIIDRVKWMFHSGICDILDLDVYEFYINDEPIINDYTLAISKALYLIYNIHQEYKGITEKTIAVKDNSYIYDIIFTKL